MGITWIISIWVVIPVIWVLLANYKHQVMEQSSEHQQAGLVTEITSVVRGWPQSGIYSPASEVQSCGLKMVHITQITPNQNHQRHHGVNLAPHTITRV